MQQIEWQQIWYVFLFITNVAQNYEEQRIEIFEQKKWVDALDHSLIKSKNDINNQNADMFPAKILDL